MEHMHCLGHCSKRVVLMAWCVKNQCCCHVSSDDRESYGCMCFWSYGCMCVCIQCVVMCCTTLCYGVRVSQFYGARAKTSFMHIPTSIVFMIASVTQHTKHSLATRDTSRTINCTNKWKPSLLPAGTWLTLCYCSPRARDETCCIRVNRNGTCKKWGESICIYIYIYIYRERERDR